MGTVLSVWGFWGAARAAWGLCRPVRGRGICPAGAIWDPEGIGWVVHTHKTRPNRQFASVHTHKHAQKRQTGKGPHTQNKPKQTIRKQKPGVSIYLPRGYVLIYGVGGPISSHKYGTQWYLWRIWDPIVGGGGVWIGDLISFIATDWHLAGFGGTEKIWDFA